MYERVKLIPVPAEVVRDLVAGSVATGVTVVVGVTDCDAPKLAIHEVVISSISSHWHNSSIC